MLVRDIRDECAFAVHDPSLGEISKAQWILCFRSAGTDARTAGWLLPRENDESILVATTTWEVAVPAGFTYIDKIYREETVNGTSVYVDEIPQAHWEIRLNGGVPVIAFITQNQLEVDKHLKIVGQGRPTIYTDENQTIDGGMESFIRERALYFAFRFLGAGLSELARWRQQMSTQAWQSSERMLMNHPQEFRMNPSARLVLGRS